MDSLPINLTDLVVVAVLLLSGLFAFLRGFVRELLVLLSWIVAGIATYFGLPYLQPLLRGVIPVEVFADVTSGLIIFLTVLIGLSITAHLVSKPIQSSDLQPLNRTLGFVFGLARGALIVSALALAGDYILPPEKWPDSVKQARTLPFIQQGAGMIASAIPEDLREESNSFGELAKESVANEARKRAFDMLVSPTSRDAAEDKPDGYRDDERANMERLIESAE